MSHFHALWIHDINLWYGVVSCSVRVLVIVAALDHAVALNVVYLNSVFERD